MDEAGVPNSFRYSPILRGFGAVVCGIIAGALIPGALQVGCSWHFPDERYSGTWGLFLWGEHWALRAVASWAAAGCAGFIAGAVARRQGAVLGAIAVIPSSLCWLAIALIGWKGRVPIAPE